jgi:hypothetical protein
MTVDDIKRAFTYDPVVGGLFWKNNNRTMKKGGRAGWEDSEYRRLKFMGRTFLEHRLVFLLHHGYLPEVIDHINCNSRDNRIENLRAASIAENVRNARKLQTTASGVKGVTLHAPTKKWKVRITVDSKQLYFGLFEDIELAELVVTEARLLHHGSFARQS